MNVDFIILNFYCSCKFISNDIKIKEKQVKISVVDKGPLISGFKTV